MVQLGLSLQHLQFDEGTQASEDVVGLGSDRVGRRAFERGILLQGLVEGFNGPWPSPAPKRAARLESAPMPPSVGWLRGHGP